MLLLTDGVHPKVVDSLLGHSMIWIMLDTYSHATPGLMHQAAEHLHQSARCELDCSLGVSAVGRGWPCRWRGVVMSGATPS